MRATCVLCAVVLVLVVDLFAKTYADETNEEPDRSSAWLNGNMAFHDKYQRTSRWGARLRNAGRPQGRAPRSYNPDDDEDEVQVFRRWGSRRMPFRGAGHKREWEETPNEEAAMDNVKRDDVTDEEQALLDDVIAYLRNKQE